MWRNFPLQKSTHTLHLYACKLHTYKSITEHTPCCCWLPHPYTKNHKNNSLFTLSCFMYYMKMKTFSSQSNNQTIFMLIKTIQSFIKLFHISRWYYFVSIVVLGLAMCMCVWKTRRGRWNLPILLLQLLSLFSHRFIYYYYWINYVFSWKRVGGEGRMSCNHFSLNFISFYQFRVSPWSKIDIYSIHLYKPINMFFW